MKIIYLHQHFRTPGESGGIRSYQFARSLAERGHDVHVITADAQRGAPRSYDEAMEGFHVHRFGVPYDNSMSVKARIASFVRFAALSAKLSRSLHGDVVLATSTPLTIALPALYAILGRPRSRFVFEVRDLWPAVPVAMGILRQPVLVWAARLLEKVTYRRADSIVALSEGMADGVRSIHPEADIRVVPNISDIVAFQDCAPAEPLLDGALEGRAVVLYCGTFGKVNGLGYMVDLAAAVKRKGSSIAFVAVGEGAEKKAVIQKARTLGVLGSSFWALAAVEKNALPGLLAQATFGSSWVIDVPALEHNSANKFFDTLAAGKPMLINHGGWQAEVLKSTGAGWRLDRDPEVAADQLVEIVRDETTEIRAAGNAALLLATERYSLPVLAHEFALVVEAAQSSRKRATAFRR